MSGIPAGYQAGSTDEPERQIWTEVEEETEETEEEEEDDDDDWVYETEPVE